MDSLESGTPWWEVSVYIRGKRYKSVYRVHKIATEKEPITLISFNNKYFNTQLIKSVAPLAEIWMCSFKNFLSGFQTWVDRNLVWCKKNFFPWAMPTVESHKQSSETIRFIRSECRNFPQNKIDACRTMTWPNDMEWYCEICVVCRGKWKTNITRPLSTSIIYTCVGCCPFLSTVSLQANSLLPASLVSLVTVMLDRDVMVMAVVECSFLLTRGPRSPDSSPEVPLLPPTIPCPPRGTLSRSGAPWRWWRRGKTLFSMCSVALTSLPAAQVHAFRKLFLKLSLRKAYSIGFIAELE